MTDQRSLTTISKFMSLVLRHEPERIGLSLGPAGWVDVEALLRQAAAHGRAITRAQLDEVVAISDKRRFAFSEDGLRIRASQGHSVDVDLALAPAAPPDALFHGTASRFLASILAAGLDRRERHHVHLTANIDTAVAVGRRHGKPVVLRIDAAAMAARGHVFHCADNGVWLVDAVAAEFIEVMP